MAAKKSTGKKTEPKKTGGKRKLGSKGVTRIDVPQGGQVIGVYELTPQLPKDGKAVEWPLIDTSTGKQVSDLVAISFNEDSSSVQIDFERAILVVNIAGEDDTCRWAFALNGFDICSIEGEGQGQVIETEIVNYGKTLLVYVQSFAVDAQETINFSFVAAYTDKVSGMTTVYESKDPGVIVGRPTRP